MEDFKKESPAIKWSDKLKFSRPLKVHQAANLDRFAEENEAGLLWEMGTGKTMTAIAWLRAKYNQVSPRPNVTKTLIISPVATLYNWEKEFKIAAPTAVCEQIVIPYLKSKKTKYTGLERADLIRGTDKKIVVLNPESLDNPSVVDALLLFRPEQLVVDEVHRFKSHRMTTANPEKKTESRLAKLLKISRLATHRMVLTGTPILNSYLDLWSQFMILDLGDTFGTNFWDFRARYFQDENERWKGQAKYFPSWVPRSGIEDEISAMIEAKCSRITKEECLDLPELVKQTYDVEMGAAQAKAYYDMEKELLVEIATGTCAAVNALTRVGRMLQILSGHLPVQNEESGTEYVNHFQDNPRLKALRELLEELTPHHKVIVWCSYRASYQSIRKLMEELSLEWAEIIGGTTDRQEEIDRFQEDPRCRVMLSHPQAGGIGIGLQQASYSIYYSRSYSLGDRLQSESRNHRAGSEIHPKITLIDLVARGTLDEDVLAALLRKEQFSDNILDRLRARC